MNRLTQFLQRWTVPLLLCTVALRQIFLTQTVGLSSWHGGGFGMFASVDRDERRILDINAVDCQDNVLKVELETPTHLLNGTDLLSEAALIHLRTVPEESLLQRTAHQILGARLQQSEPDADVYYAVQPSETELPTCLQQVQIQVWRVHHQRGT
ncbi:MAG: hypothetical protein AAGC54_06410, partial [Cyanobacteria bacterium P01_F01_bin.4]